MINYQLISSILSGAWLIDRNYAESQLPFIVSMLEGKIQATEPTPKRSGRESTGNAYAIDPTTMQTVDIYERGEWGEIVGLKNNLPKNLVGVLPISGPITKYDAFCGGPGMITRGNSLNDLQAHPAINSILMLMDTPGGEARAAQPFTDAVKNSSKPVIAYVDGLCASMGMWYASAAKETYLSTRLDTIGSIGAYVQFADFTGYYEKAGIKVHTIYAPQSTDKNKTYRDILDGKEEGLQAEQNELATLVDEFIGHVANSRPKAAANQAAWRTGKTFHADEAIQYGLADGVMPLQKAVKRASLLGRIQQS